MAKYIINSKQIDKVTVLRKRVLLTPAVCDICGFDLCEANKLKPYAEMSPAEQKAAREAIDEHKSRFHAPATAQIVEEDQLPKAWLGDDE